MPVAAPASLADAGDDEPRVVQSTTVVMDGLYYYYPFGNSPPVYLTAGVAPGREQANILCLGSGDVRSTIYTLSEEHAAGRNADVLFTCCDISPYVVARNAVLIAAVRGGGARAADVGAWWFSMGLTQAQGDALSARMAALRAYPSVEALRADHPYLTMTPGTWQAVRRVLGEWLGMGLTWDGVAALKDSKLMGPNEAKAQDRDVALSQHIMFFAPVRMLNTDVESIDHHRAEFEAYAQTHIFQDPGHGSARLEDHPVINPTLFTSASQYTLHYGSCAYTAFSAVGADRMAGKDRPLARHCFAQFREWVQGARAYGGDVLWELDAGDCVHLCHRVAAARPQVYDVVSTSNVADHIGVAPLLTSCRAVVRATGRLEVVSFTHSSDGGTEREYLQRELALPAELLPALMGWRCVGGEPEEMRPLTARGQWDALPDILVGLMGEGGQRQPTTFHFVPAPLLPGRLFDLAGSPYALCALQGMLRHEGKWGARCGRFRAPAYLPVLLRLLPGPAELDEVLRTAPRPEDAELRALFALLSGAAPPADYTLLDIPCGRLQPQYHLLGQVAPSVRCGAHVATRVWASGGGGAPTTSLHALVPTAWSAAAVVEVIDEFGQGLGTLPATARPLRAVPAGFPEAACGGGGVADARGAALQRWGVDEDGGVRLEVALGGEWMRELGGAGVTLDVLSAGAGDGDRWEDFPTGAEKAAPPQAQYGVVLTLRSRKKGVPRGFTLALPTPGPVRVPAARILLSRRRGHVTLLLPPGQYPLLHGHVRTDVSARARRAQDAPAAMLPYPARHRQSLETFSGLQFNTEEKYLARSGETAKVPPLIAMKDSLTVFFQTDDTFYHLGPPSVQVQGSVNTVMLAWVHGKCLHRLSGVLHVDLSFCVLTPAIVPTVVPPWQAASTEAGHLVRSVVLADGEEPVLKAYFAAQHARLKCGGAPHPALPSWARPFFKRALLAPLLMPQVEVLLEQQQQVPQLQRDGAPSSSSSPPGMVARLKAAGAAHVAAEEYVLAVADYQRAVNLLRHEAGTAAFPGTAREEALVACLSNLAHCYLRLGGAARAGEARRACQDGLDQLASLGGRVKEEWGTRMRTKLQYRQGKALEQLGGAVGATAATAHPDC